MMQGIETLPEFKQTADYLATFGREGDTYIVHAEEGETVVPLKVLEANPKMKKMLFSQMEEMGLDPEQYVVGNELNSINPVTGQPEFFFKKLFKKLKGVVKKIAPVVLPMVAPMLFPAMPLALSTGIGSFAGSMIGGSKPKDALRNAVITGGISGLGSMASGRGFLGRSPTYKTPMQKLASDQAYYDKYGVDLSGNVTTPESMGMPEQTFTGDDANFYEKYIERPINVGKEFYETNLSPSRPSLNVSDEALKEAMLKDVTKYENILGEGSLDASTKKAMLDKLIKDSQPSTFQKYLPLAMIGAGGIGAYSLMNQPEEEEEYSPITGADLLEMDPDKYYAGKDFLKGNPYYDSSYLPMIYRESGGEISGPGTGTSDSIPAMLSDGEFVFTASAVKGAGGGNRKKGAAKMYQMMKQLENKVA